MYLLEKEIRKTDQFELPMEKEFRPAGKYDVYPVHNIGDGRIFRGYDSLAKALASESCVKLDGYIGIIFEDVKEKLNAAFERTGVKVHWINVKDAMKGAKEIDFLVEPYLGGDDPVFGRICPFQLTDFLVDVKLQQLSRIESKDLKIYYGIGASLVPVRGKVVFFDISKNEIQFRSRAGAIANLGAEESADAKDMYKRFYFIDWMILNRHVNAIKSDIDYFVDGQRSIDITWMHGDGWRNSMNQISERPIRVRPWFEPGPWGGTWIQDKIDGIEKDVVNYAWSFELIVPENGVLLESSGILLESTFDSLMFLGGQNILGRDYETYGNYFPIRFDFLDTFNGSNLSVQCHPGAEYMKEQFGEFITQEETYYILDRQENAIVYLGFQDGVTSDEFRQALETSQQQNQPIDIPKYVQTFQADKHDLFLIPPGTIHASGKGNLVLEISSTPYIYTFKMYDWLRVDLDGKPRPLNIDRGMENLVFERSGNKVKEELISKPILVEKDSLHELYQLPTHKEHLYDVHRYEVFNSVSVKNDNKAHVLSLVEGEKVEILIGDKSFHYSYAETFIVPASVENYTIRNSSSSSPIKVIKAFIK